MLLCEGYTPHIDVVKFSFRGWLVSITYRLYAYTSSRLICFNFLKKVHLVQCFEKKFFFFVCSCFFLKSSMNSFLKYILDSIYVFKVVDFIFFLLCTGRSSFCCVNNGTCNCV